MKTWQRYKLMGEWRETSLGEVVSSNNSSITSDYSHEKILYLDTGSITRGHIDGFQEIDLSEAPSRAKRLVQENDIIYSTVRPIQRHYGFITNPPENLVVSTGFSVITTDTEKACPKFIYYNLISDLAVEELDVIADASTSAYPSLKPSDIENFSILLPSNLYEQEAIAEVLSSLDDKIDLLHRQNKTLEALAETLFRHTFIDNAQDDWEEGTLDDVLTVKGGTTPSTKNPNFWDGDILWTTPRDLSNNSGMYLLDTARKITEQGLAKISSGLLPAGVLLLSSRAPVGYLAFSTNPIAINQGYIAILDDKGFSKHFIYLWLLVNMDVVKNHANGSTFQEISKTSFKQIKITKPDQDSLNDFDEEVLPIFQKIEANTLQIQTLENLRDTLLPKLMSGEVRVQYDEVA